MLFLSTAEAASTTTLDHNMITTIIAVVAIVSPMLTTIINGIFTVINKKMDNEQKKFEKKQQTRERDILHSRDIINPFVQSLEEYLLYPTDENKKKYQKTVGVTLLYVPQNTRDVIRTVNSFINKNDLKNASIWADKLIDQITTIKFVD